MIRAPRRRRANPMTDAYAWITNSRAYTDRIKAGPVTSADLAGQQHINDAAERVAKALEELNVALPNQRLTVVFGDVSLPLLTYIAMIVVPRVQWAEPKVKPILRKHKNSVRSSRSRR